MARNLGSMPRSVRRLVLRGWSADAIARLYRLRPADVAAMLSCPLPARPAPRPPRPVVRREWGWAQGPAWRDEPAPPPAIAAAEVLEPVRVEVLEPVPLAEDWGALAGGRVGRRSPTAALSDAEADRVRELRARGIPRKDVAAMLGVSVATITRITRGETYRPAALVEPDQVVAELPPPPPAIAAAEVPGEAWEQPAGWQSRRAGREWRDD